MKKIIDSYFDFSRSERRGLLSLSLLIVLFVFSPTIYKLFKSAPITDFKAFEKAVALLETQTVITASSQNETQNSNKPIKLFSFNPNTLSADSLALLGLNKKVINNIINYRNKGGRFYKKENFKKIYSLTDSTYLNLADYITIPQKQKTKPVQVNQKNELKKSANIEISLVEFDPNKADKDLLLQLGLSKKVINTIFNFRNKGGKFYKKEDLQKIYGLQPAQYQQLAPFIVLDNETTKPGKNKFATKKESLYPPKKQTPVAPIDINRADHEEWQKLKGIGPFYSERIIEYREKLGGFARADQIKEIYGFPDSVFQKIQPFLKDSDLIQKININTAKKEDLAAHPYINYKKAKTIINYRGQHGAFKSLDELKKVGVLNDELIARIKPYLSL